MHKFFIWI